MLPEDRQYEVILDNLYPSWHWSDLIKASTEIASVATYHQFGLRAFRSPPSKYLDFNQATYSVISKALAIELHMAWLLRESASMEGEARKTMGQRRLTEEVSWRELRLVIERGNDTHYYSLRDLDLSVVPWTRLLRLSIHWQYNVPINEFILGITPQLMNLEALRLHAGQKRLFHPKCRYQAPSIRMFEDPPEMRPFALDFTKMRHLRELEIDGICNHVSVVDLVGPNLRSLRLHSEDPLFSVYSLESQLFPDDVLAAARLAPNLERLELDIGYIDKLWYPTAIVGVDVDVGQYSFLNALTKFRHLRFLRLFPPFVPKDSPRHSRSITHTLPVTDDQAIRIFEHLRGKCPSLQLLSIAAIPSLLNIDTMTWDLKRRGDRTILTTGHRARNYQHRQTWIGQRRIRSEIKRFNTPQTYLPDSDSWMLPRHDHIIRQHPQDRWLNDNH